MILLHYITYYTNTLSDITYIMNYPGGLFKARDVAVLLVFLCRLAQLILY